jgi:hypothetical protein
VKTGFKPTLKQILTRLRWLVLFVSLGMMVASYYGVKACDYLNHVYPPSGPPNMFNGRFDPLALCLFVPMVWLGIFLFVVSSLWILVTAVISSTRWPASKQPEQS